MKGLLIHLAFALLWSALGTPSPGRFLGGVLLGFAVLAVLRRVFGVETYVRRAWGFLRFLLVFTGEFLKSNLAVARTVLFEAKETLHPDFIRYDLTGLRLGEILLLSHCITLTPGTTSVEISPDHKTLVIHALDARDPDSLCRGIDTRLRAAILAFTR